MAKAVDPPEHRSASRRRKTPRPAAGCHPRRSARNSVVVCSPMGPAAMTGTWPGAPRSAGGDGFWYRRSRPEALCVQMPYRIVGAEAHKPAKQQVVVELLQQQLLGQGGIDGGPFHVYSLQKVGSRRSSPPIRQLEDPPEQIAGRDPVTDLDVGDQIREPLRYCWPRINGHAVAPISQRYLGFSANSYRAGCWRPSSDH
jgi:hypothetical protein